MPLMYCGVFSCKETDCDYHIKTGEKFDMPSNFKNLMYSPVCKLPRDCEHCKHQKYGECQVWDCEYEKEDK